MERGLIPWDVPQWVPVCMTWCGAILLALSKRRLHATRHWQVYYEKALRVAVVGAVVLSVWSTTQWLVGVFNLPILDHRIVAAALVSFSWLDIQLTKKGLSYGAREQNPWMRWVIKKAGYRWAFIFAATAMLSICLFMLEGAPTYTAYVLLVMYICVLVSNFLIIRKLSKKRSRALVVVRQGEKG
ncbi:hypothetical protein ES703_99642 [subsurface metagenome]